MSQKTLLYLLTFSFLLLCSTSVRAVPEDNLLYKGRMGEFAIVEDQTTGEQKLLRQGETWGDYRIQTIAQDKLVCLSPQGVETVLPRHFGAAANPAQNFPPIAGHPYQEFLERDRTMLYLQQTKVTLHYHNMPLREAVTELGRLCQREIILTPEEQSKESEVPPPVTRKWNLDIVLAPEIYKWKMFDELPTVTLTTGEISLYQAISLVAAYGGMSCVLENDRLLLMLAGTRYEDPFARYLRGLAVARRKVLETGRVRETLGDKKIELPAARPTLGHVLTALQTSGSEVVVGSEVVDSHPPYFSGKGQIAFADLVDRLAQNAHADYVLVDGVLYLVGMAKR